MRKPLLVNQILIKVYGIRGGESMLPYVIEEVKRLSQQEGLTDKEIADILGCSRATVNRARQAHNIPKANLENRKDKEKKECRLCRLPPKVFHRKVKYKKFGG